MYFSLIYTLGVVSINFDMKFYVPILCDPIKDVKSTRYIPNTGELLHH